MVEDIKIRNLESSDNKTILKIANWYFDEWNTPTEKTIHRLSSQPNEDVLFQLVLSIEDKVIGTVGLCHEVNLLRVYPKFRNLQPWVALLYVDKKYRNKGLGKLLLAQIERQAKALNLNKIYLYTFTAESLYKKCGWRVIDRVRYKNQDTAIMVL